MLAAPAVAVQELQSSGAVRERCANVMRAVEAGHSHHFRVDRSRLPFAARMVADFTRVRYRDLAIPYHSRWRQFDAGGRSRVSELNRHLACYGALDRLRAQIDLCIVSVLLDAGAGAAWRYREPGTIDDYARSEGLAVASFRAFMGGAFSASPGEPLRVDAAALTAFDAATLAQWFQVTPRNPLVGLEGRAALLRRLGDLLETRPDRFGLTARPSALFDRMLRAPAVSAVTILRAVLDGFGDIWRVRASGGDAMPGDVWRHPHAKGTGASEGFVPFHKLSQWLAYSLFEPFEWAGIPVTDRDALTGLPEYRNGGLFLDAGVLELVEPRAREFAHAVSSELVIEWRALTLALLDRTATLVQRALGVSAEQLPLARVLEGGTWRAGRAIALEHRPDGRPPLLIDSDGTVF